MRGLYKDTLAEWQAHAVLNVKLTYYIAHIPLSQQRAVLYLVQLSCFNKGSKYGSLIEIVSARVYPMFFYD